MGPFLKFLLNLLQYCFCFMCFFLFFGGFFAFWPWGIWDFGSPARDGICTPCIGRQSLLNYWTSREVPLLLNWLFPPYFLSPWCFHPNSNKTAADPHWVPSTEPWHSFQSGQFAFQASASISSHLTAVTGNFRSTQAHRARQPGSSSPVLSVLGLLLMMQKTNDGAWGMVHLRIQADDPPC